MDRISGLLSALPLSTWFLVVFPSCLVLYWFLWILYTRTLHPLASVPGPFWASVSRIWYMYRIYIGDMDKVQRSLHERYGPVVRIAPNEVSTTEIPVMSNIYKHQRPLVKTDFYSVWQAKGFGDHLDLFSQPDERLHSNYRKIVNPVYTLSNVLKSETQINKVSELFIQRLGEHADRRELIDLGWWLQMYAFDVIGEIFFGGMFGFLEHSKDHGDFIASLDAIMPVMTMAAIAPTYLRPFVMASFLFMPAAMKAGSSFKRFAKVADEASQKRVKEMEAGQVHRGDMLQQLLDITWEKGEKLNFGRRQVVMEGAVAMGAGSDTTAIAFRAVFYYLMRNPEKLRKAHAEIDVALAAGVLSSPIKYSETTTKLPYICACIKEAMRMHPSVALSIPRYAPEDGIRMADKFIPKGYRVGLNPAVIHYNKEVFGPDADQFRPERWLVSEEKWKIMEKGLLVFGAGTRVCIGKNISLAELHTLVPEVLRHFNLEMAHDQPWRTYNRWFNKQTGLLVKVARR